MPLYQGVEPLPETNPPPWIQTITGRAPSSTAGVTTLRVRQSSSQSGSGPVSRPPSAPAACHDTGPNRVASRVSAHGSAGSGGRNRSGPVGGAAYGMPANSTMPSFSRPRTAPVVVMATVSAIAAP